MKDQNTIPDGETKKDKWNRGLDIFIESVIEPDPALRACAHNQKCYHEDLMDVREGCAKLSQNIALALMTEQDKKSIHMQLNNICNLVNGTWKHINRPLVQKLKENSSYLIQ